MRRWLRSLVSGRRLDRELDAELRFHIDMETQKCVRQGLSPGEARSVATLEIPLPAGRDVSDRDTATSPLVAIVSATARKLFPDDPQVIGRRIIMGSLGGSPVMEIVGVADVRSQSLAATAEVEVYRPVTQRPRTFMPLVGVTTLGRAVDRSLAQQRLLFTLLAVFAGVAVVLSTVGISGVGAAFVGQRRIEIGVRATAIVQLVMRESLPPVAVGLAAGLVAAAALGRFVQTLLFGVSALDPTLFAVAALGLAVATVAAAVPARRAARISPIEAIRGS